MLAILAFRQKQSSLGMTAGELRCPQYFLAAAGLSTNSSFSSVTCSSAEKDKKIKNNKKVNESVPEQREEKRAWAKQRVFSLAVNSFRLQEKRV